MNGQPAPDVSRTETIDSVVDQSCGVKINVLGASNNKIKDDVDILSQDLDSNAQQRIKKSSFQITKIVNKVDKPRVDDPDDVTNTEDASSEILEVSRNTDVEIDPVSPDTLRSTSSDDNGQVLAATAAATPASPSTQNLLPQLSNSIKRRTNNGNSRFKIVQIESHKPHKRGRWTCQEFADPPQCTSSSSTKVQKTGSSCSNNDSGSGNSSVSNSIYYVHGEEDSSTCPFTAAIVYSDGHLVLDPNLVNNSLGNGAVVAPISSQSQCSTLESNMQFGLLQTPKSFSPIFQLSLQQQIIINQLSREDTTLQHLHGCSINGLDSVDGSNIFDSNQFVSKARSDFFLSNSNHAEINLFASSNDNASMLDLLDPDNSIAGSFCALDNKIEQAMDLVKSHLRFAVGEEVGMLKEQIKELCFRKSMLEYENTILPDATPETLAKIHQPVANHSPSNTDLNSLPS